MTSIYGLYDAAGNLRYIGKANDPAKRLKAHMRETMSGRRNYPVNNWIRKNGQPEMRILSADCGDWKSEERRLIAEARARGDNLLNVAEGGDEPHCSEDVRRANARALNERIANDPDFAEVRDIKRKMSAYLRGKHVSPERKEEMKAKLREIATINPRLFGAWPIFDRHPHP